MAYNMSFVDTSDTFLDLWSGVNNLLDGKFIAILLLVTFIIMFVAMKRFETKVVAITGSSIMTLLAIIAWSLGWITFSYIFVPLALFLGSLAVWGLSD